MTYRHSSADHFEAQNKMSRKAPWSCKTKCLERPARWRDAQAWCQWLLSGGYTYSVRQFPFWCMCHTVNGNDGDWGHQLPVHADPKHRCCVATVWSSGIINAPSKPPAWEAAYGDTAGRFSLHKYSTIMMWHGVSVFLCVCVRVVCIFVPLWWFSVLLAPVGRSLSFPVYNFVLLL